MATMQPNRPMVKSKEFLVINLWLRFVRGVWPAWQCERRNIRSPLISQAHTVVWECCKDDQQSQWEMLKFDPQLPLNPLSDRHQIWRAWLRHGYLSPRKNWAQSVKGFLLPIYAKYTPPMFAYPCLLLFLVLPIAYSRDACMDFNA